MPLLLSLGGMFVMLTSSILGRALLAMGFGLVTYTGFSVLLSSIISELKSSFNGMPSVALGFLAWLWVDKAISILIAAVNTALAIQFAGAAGGVVRKWVVTRPTML